MVDDDIVVQEVNASVVIDGSVESVTYAEVNRSVGIEAGHAKVKAVIEDTSSLSVGDTVVVRVNENVLFRGELQKAVEDGEGLIVIDAYDERLKLHNSSVVLNIEEPQSVFFILLNLLNDAGYTVGDTPNDVLGEPDPVILTPKSSFPGGDSTITNGYGSGSSGEKFSQVVNDLVGKLNGVIWVDTDNILRIEPYPEHNSYIARYILEKNSGNDTTDIERVIVSGGGATGTDGLAASHVYNQVSPRSELTNDDKESGGGEKITIDDQNIVTQNTANAVATSEYYRNGRSITAGDVKMVGNVDVDVFDSIKVPSIQREPTVTSEFFRKTTLTGTRAFEKADAIFDNTYSVKSVTHTIDATEGFTTLVEFSLEPGDFMGATSGVAGALRDEFLDGIEENKQDRGILSFIEGFE